VATETRDERRMASTIAMLERQEEFNYCIKSIGRGRGGRRGGRVDLRLQAKEKRVLDVDRCTSGQSRVEIVTKQKQKKKKKKVISIRTDASHVGESQLE
jgi:hypothetical protein